MVHTYTAGNEPYSVWEGLQRGSKEYEDMKQQRAETLWKVGETLSAVCVLCAGLSAHHSAITCGGSTVRIANLQWQLHLAQPRRLCTEPSNVPTHMPICAQVCSRILLCCCAAACTRRWSASSLT